MASSRKPRNAEALECSLDALVARRLARDVRVGETVTVGLSGGIDSIVLLDLMRRAARGAGIGLRALHVNHGLSKNAAVWERFCADHCRRRGIAFQAVAVDLGGRSGNVEARARAARYDAFSRYGSEVMALAHNQDDQAETVLLHLLRGSGVRGLAAMPSMRPLDMLGRRVQNEGGQRLIRPLLDVPRSVIHAHALSRRLKWIEDESNADERFARNYLRRRVLPVLERRFEGCRANLARAAAHLDEAAGLLDELAALDCAAVSRDGRINVDSLKALGRARAANALRRFLAVRGEPPLSAVRTREVLGQLTTGRRDARPELRLDRTVLSRYRGWIELRPSSVQAADSGDRVWHGERRLGLGDAGELITTKTRGAGVSAARLRGGTVTIRHRRGGERIRLFAGGPTRTLKNLLQEAAFRSWQREAMPLVFCDEQLVWVPQVGVASEFQARADEDAWRFEWRMPE